jgi:hypothetical protein
MIRRILVPSLVLALAAPFFATAQEQVPREECLKIAFALSLNLKELLATPIPTDPDVKRPVAVKHGDYGGMVLPETKLAESLAKAGTEPVSIGQLWLHKLVPVKDGQPVAADKLRVVKVTHRDETAEVVCCALGVRKSGEGFELLFFGKDKTPVFKTPLKASPEKQEEPIEISADRQGDSGFITLKIAGKYQATFEVTDPDQ